MLTKASLFLFIAFAVGMCEVPTYSRYVLEGEYTYEDDAYQIVSATYEVKSGSGRAYMLFESGEDDFDIKNAKAICVDLRLVDCRTKFGQQLRAGGKKSRESSGMGY